MVFFQAMLSSIFMDALDHLSIFLRNTYAWLLPTNLQKALGAAENNNPTYTELKVYQ